MAFDEQAYLEAHTHWAYYSTRGLNGERNCMSEARRYRLQVSAMEEGVSEPELEALAPRIAEAVKQGKEMAKGGYMSNDELHNTKKIVDDAYGEHFGLDKDGFDKDGRNLDGFDRFGLDSDGLNAVGRDTSGRLVRPSSERIPDSGVRKQVRG